MAERKATLLITLRDEATKGLERLRSVTRGVTDIYFALNAALAVVNQTFGRAIGLAKDALRAYAEHESAVKKLNHALETQGFTTKGYSEKLIALSKELQRVTTFSDEAVLETIRLLTTFGLAGKELDGATKAALDLSVGLGIGLHSAALMLGKAWQGNTAALSRYVGEIDRTAPAAQRLEQALKLINGRVGGAATRELDEYAGKVKKLKDNFSELLESAGSKLIGPATGGVNFLNYLLTGQVPGGRKMGWEELQLPGGTPGGKAGPQSKEPWDAEEGGKRIAKYFAKQNEIIDSELGRQMERYRGFENQQVNMWSHIQTGAIAATVIIGDSLGQMMAGKQQSAKAFALALINTFLDMAMAIVTAAILVNQALTWMWAPGIGLGMLLIALGTLAVLKGAANVALSSSAGSIGQEQAQRESAARAQASETTKTVPAAAEGMIVLPTSGGTLVRVGEAGQAEAIVPLGGPSSKGRAAGMGSTVVIQAGTIIATDYDIRKFAERIDEELYKLRVNRQAVSF